MQRIPPEALTEPYMRQLSEQFPDIDRYILKIFLEEVNYNCEAAAALIREEEARYAQLAESPDDSKPMLEMLQAEFPSASAEQIEFFLEVYPGDLEQVRQSLAEEVEQDPDNSDYEGDDPEFADEVQELPGRRPHHDDPEFADEVQELPRRCPHHDDPEFADEVRELPNPSLETLAGEFPDIDKDMLRECLEAAGNLNVARQWILEQFPEDRSRRNQRPKRQVIHVFHEVPREPPRRKRGKRKRPRGQNPFTAPKPDAVEQLVELGCDRERAIEALQLTGGDVNRAANVIFNAECVMDADEPAPETPAEVLHSVFPSTPLQEIEEVLEQVEGDIEHAGRILEQRLTENPPLEDSVLALVPEVTVEQARESLRRAGGNVRRAAALAYRYRPRHPPPPRRRVDKKILTVDLHGFTAQEAYAYVSRAVRRAKQSGDVRQINFITGRGLHSRNGPVLRPLVCRLCRDLHTNAFIGPNPGVVVCNLGV